MAPKIASTLPIFASDLEEGPCRLTLVCSDITCSSEICIHFGVSDRPSFEFVFEDPELLAAVIAGQHQLAHLFFLFKARQRTSTARAFHKDFSSAMSSPLQASEAIRETSRLDHHRTPPAEGRTGAVPHIRHGISLNHLRHKCQASGSGWQRVREVEKH